MIVGLSKIISFVFCVSFVVLWNRCFNVGILFKNGIFDIWLMVFDFIKLLIIIILLFFVWIIEFDFLIEFFVNGSLIFLFWYKIFLVCCLILIIVGCICSNMLFWLLICGVIFNEILEKKGVSVIFGDVCVLFLVLIILDKLVI